MSINQVGNGQPPPIQQQQISASTASESVAKQSAGRGSDTSNVESNLIKSLNISTVESQGKNLDQVIANVESGALLTREAAESTASSILNQ